MSAEPDPRPMRFRDAMASFPSGVTIVTTADRDGRWWGFTATSFCSLSVEPPLVLVCLAKRAECHPVFLTAERFVIHVIPPGPRRARDPLRHPGSREVRRRRVRAQPPRPAGARLVVRRAGV